MNKYINTCCVSGKKKPQENKNKGSKTEDIQLKTSEPDSTSANMRDSAEGTLGYWTCVIPICVTGQCSSVCPWSALLKWS